MQALNGCFAKSSNVVTREIAGEMIIVPIRDNAGDLNAIYTLNGVGTSIWRLIDGENSVSDIARAVSEEYDVSFEDARRDTGEFLLELENAGLVQRKV